MANCNQESPAPTKGLAAVSLRHPPGQGGVTIRFQCLAAESCGPEAEAGAAETHRRESESQPGESVRDLKGSAFAGGLNGSQLRICKGILVFVQSQPLTVSESARKRKR